MARHRLSSTLAITLVLASTLALPLVQADPPFVATLRGPAYALVDASVTYTGVYGLGAPFVQVPLPARNVRLYVDGEPADLTPAPTGSFSLLHSFGARGTHTVHAVAEEGLPTSGQSPTLTVRAAVPPSAPLNVSATPAPGGVSALITWSPPADDGGAPIASYQIFRQDGNVAFIPRGSIGPTQRSFTDTGLTLGHTYRFRVVASNMVVAGAAAEVPLLGDAPQPPTITATPIDASDKVRVTVTAGGGVTQQVVAERSFDGDWWQPLTTGLTSIVTNDSVGMPATPMYRAYARNLVGNSAPTVTAVTGALPGASDDLTATVTPDAILLEWSRPASGGAVQGYRIYDNGVERDTLSWNANSTQLSTTPGTHDYTVVATSARGDGAPSNVAQITLAAASAATDLTSVVTEQTRWADVALAWGAPTSDGGAPITSYRVYRSMDAGGYSRIATLNASTLQYTNDHVSPGHTYHYQIRAVTVAGEGASASVDATVASFDWALTHDILSFRACETINGNSQCTTVAPGGSYDRVGSGSVTYAATYGGLLTRRGVPASGQGIGGLMHESWDVDGELAESWWATTNATGEYAATWSQSTSLTPQPGCSTASFDSYAGFDTVYVNSLGDSFQICP